jgi:hypothetical protein
MTRLMMTMSAPAGAEAQAKAATMTPERIPAEAIPIRAEAILTRAEATLTPAEAIPTQAAAILTRAAAIPTQAAAIPTRARAARAQAARAEAARTQLVRQTAMRLPASWHRALTARQAAGQTAQPVESSRREPSARRRRSYRLPPCSPRPQPRDQRLMERRSARA